MAGGQVTAPCTRDDPPDLDDFGLCVRIVGGIGPIVIVSQVQPTIGVQTVVPASAVTVTLLAANGARLGASFYNNSPSRFIFLRLGAGASTAVFTVRMAPRSFYEVEWPTYTGIVTGVWNIATGDCQVTELT